MQYVRSEGAPCQSCRSCKPLLPVYWRWRPACLSWLLMQGTPKGERAGCLSAGPCQLCRLSGSTLPCCAGTPFVILNTCAGSLMVYGLAGLRSDVSSIFIFMAIMSLHTLVSNNFLVTCIWLTPTQARPGWETAKANPAVLWRHCLKDWALDFCMLMMLQAGPACMHSAM